MPDSPAKIEWTKNNTTQFTLKLNHNTDADIIKALEGKARQTEVKRLIRIALKQESK